MKQGYRLESLDTLRGFDMFFIMGGDLLLISLAALLPCGVTEFFAGQMHHVAWDGFAIKDMVFPLFLFIAGISFPFSAAKSRSQGITQGRLYLKILRRAILLVILGMVYNGLLKLDFEHMRYASVLARIGIAWAVSAVLFLNFGIKTRAAIAAAILIGYWLLLWLVPAPDAAGASPFSLEGNLVGYVDRLLLPGALVYDTFDPEGLLSTLPAVVTAMLGMMTGELVLSDRHSGAKKAAMIAAAGLALVIIGKVWDLQFPINKKLWTSSYVCFVGGLSAMLFSLFYYIIDVRGIKGGTLFFKVIGMNSITIYMFQRMVKVSYTTDFLSKGLAGLLPETASGFVYAVFYIAVCWCFLYFLYRKNTFLKV